MSVSASEQPTKLKATQKAQALDVRFRVQQSGCCQLKRRSLPLHPILQSCTQNLSKTFKKDLMNEGRDITQRMTQNIVIWRNRNLNGRLKEQMVHAGTAVREPLLWQPALLRAGSSGPGGADGGVADLGHGGGHGRGHGGGGEAIFSRFSLPAAGALAAEPIVAAAGEGGTQGHAEASVHEAVNDGVDAGGGVGKQVDEGDGRSWEGPGGWPQVKGFPGVSWVQRHPADEEERYDDHQHADDSLLGLQLGLRGVPAGALSLGLGGGRRGREGGELHGRGGFFSHLDVAAIVFIVRPGRSRPACTVLLACGGWGAKVLVSGSWMKDTSISKRGNQLQIHDRGLSLN